MLPNKKSLPGGAGKSNTGQVRAGWSGAGVWAGASLAGAVLPVSGRSEAAGTELLVWGACAQAQSSSAAASGRQARVFFTVQTRPSGVYSYIFRPANTHSGRLALPVPISCTAAASVAPALVQAGMPSKNSTSRAARSASAVVTVSTVSTT